MEVMTGMKISLVFILLSGFLFLSPLPVESADTRGQMVQPMKGTTALPMPEYLPMPAPGKKVPIGYGYYLIYGFDKQPKLGTVIMKVENFTAEGKKDTSLEVRASADMPSMKGAHIVVERAFKLSKRGDYVTPIDIVMPGDWEIKLTVVKDGKVIFRGRYNFNV
jgi:hypothetical protein